MNKALLPLTVLVIGIGMIWAQRSASSQPAPKDVATWEYRALIPQEVGTAAYRQVDWIEVQSLGNLGWELVSVTPFVIRNDEHPDRNGGNPKVVTQSYFAYYFKRRHEPQR